MQNPFVICKLFKKQDPSLVEEAVSSPTSSPDETKVVVEAQGVKPESSLVISGDSHNGAWNEATTSQVSFLLISILIASWFCKLNDIFILMCHSLEILIGCLFQSWSP